MNRLQSRNGRLILCSPARRLDFTPLQSDSPVSLSALWLMFAAFTFFFKYSNIYKAHLNTKKGNIVMKEHSLKWFLNHNEG